jgi:glycine/D-amino acid oxidase-like deaminating enzyme
MASASAQEELPKSVVICGGGIIGASIAYYLAKRGVASTIIERSAVACAASGKAGGFLALDWSDGTDTGPLARRSFHLHGQLAQELPDDTGYRRVHTLAVTCSAQPGAKVSKRAAAGTPEWVDGNVLKTQAMGDESTTAQVHPARLTAAFVAAAERNAGSTVRLGTVTGVKLGGSDGQRHVEGVEVDGEVLPADAVVVAMGPWSGQAADWGLPVPRVSGQKATSILLRPAADISADMLFLEYRNKSGRVIAPEVYPRPDGSVYICGEGDANPLPDDPATIEPTQSVVDVLQDVANTISSQLAAAPMETQQACFLPVSPDGNPLIGALPGVKGAYVAAGHSCWGILNSPATGEAMAEIILDGAAKTTDVSQLDPARFVGRRGKLWV